MQRLTTALTPLALLLTRVLLGGYLAGAGIAKAIGELNEGLGNFYGGKFKGLQPEWLPDAFAAPYGYALPWLEIIIGLMLVLGLFGRIAAVLTGLMILSFTIALAMKMGITAQPADAASPFSANYIMVAVSFLLACLGPGRLSLDRLLRGRQATHAPADR